MALPVRKRNRLDGFSYREYGAYFITVCTAERKSLFWRNPSEKVPADGTPKLSPIGAFVNQAITEIENRYPRVYVKKYAIMPDHIHMILTQENQDASTAPSIPQIIGQLKRTVSRNAGYPVWQKSFYDRIIRNEAEYQEIWKYIDENPMAVYMDKF